MKCGIDIVDSARVEKMIKRRGRDKLDCIWTKDELTACTDSKGMFRYHSLAARFACKEAVAKAIGTGFRRHGVSPAEIEIVKNAAGEPSVVLHGQTKSFFESCGFHSVSVSLTHTKDLAAAVCIIE